MKAKPAQFGRFSPEKSKTARTEFYELPENPEAVKLPKKEQLAFTGKDGPAKRFAFDKRRFQHTKALVVKFSFFGIAF